MGSYFSLHSEADWQESIALWQTPSLWKTAIFQPLRGPGRGEPQLFFKRHPERVEDEVSFAFPNGIRYQDGVFRFGYHSRVSVLCAVDLDRGRFYSGLLLEAEEASPHVYEHPACCPLDPNEIVDLPPRRKSASQSGSLQTTGMTEFSSRAASPVDPMMARVMAARINASKRLRQRLGTASSWFTQGVSAPAHLMTRDEGADAACGVWNSFPLQLEKAMDPQGDLRKIPGGNLPLDVTRCRYLLLHQVADGLLGFMSQDLDGCAEVLREVAIPEAESAGRQDLGEVRCIQFPVARTTKVNGLVEAVQREMQRRFYVQRLSVVCNREEQDEFTNCAYFCARALKSLHMSLRGFDVRGVAQQHREIGPLASDVAATAWEEVWKSARP